MFSTYTVHELELTFITRKTGSDFHINSYSGFNLPEDYVGQKFEGFQSKIVGLNAYWIFNNKKFHIRQHTASLLISAAAVVRLWLVFHTHTIVFLSIIPNYQPR